MSYVGRLREREQQIGRPVRVGLVGAGQMGRGFVAQVSRISGMHLSAVADVQPQLGFDALRSAGYEKVASGPAVQVVESGGSVVVSDALDLVDLPIDIIVDASGVPEVGASVAFNGLLAGKDIALLNVECDVTVGYVLSNLAQQMGRVYTVCRGDEPAECKALIDYVRDVGFEIACAGKGKNNPLDPTATPDSVAVQAAAKHMNPKMLASFVDGSKTMIEMAALANATGLSVPRRGMTGPHSTVEGLADTFRPKSEGGVLDRTGVVDYCTGSVAPGVFVIGYCPDEVVTAEMEYLSMGKGPYYAFYRPYHLASVEAPLTVAEAMLDRTPSLAPTTWTAEVVAVAKRDLAAGDRIDGIGGETVYGITDDAAVAAAEELVPLGLVAGARVLRPVAQGTPLTAQDVELDDTTTIAHLRKLQDKLLAARPAAAQWPATAALSA